MKEEKMEVASADTNGGVVRSSTMIKWPWWKKLLIGGGEFGENMSNAMFTTFFSVFCTDVALIAPWIVTLIVWVSKIWDAINDVIIGIMADRTRSKLGRYRPWILTSAIPFIIITTLSFLTNTGWSNGMRVFFAVFCYCAFTWVYTMFYIPYTSMQATLTQDPNERSSIGSIRITLAVLASWIVGSFAPAFVARFSTSFGVEKSYALTALIFSAIGAPFIFLSGVIGKEFIKPVDYDEKKKDRKKLEWKKVFGVMKHNKYLALVMIGNLVGQVFMAGRNATIMYYFMYKMNNLALIPIFVTLLRFPMMAGNFLSQFFVRKVGSKGKVIAGSFIIAGILCFITSFMDTMNNLVPFFILSAIIAFLTGMGYAQSIVVISDTVDYTELKTGERMEGVISSFVSFANKVGNAIGISLPPLLLAITGYVAGAVQSHKTLIGIQSSMYYIPGILALIAGIAFLFYKLDNKKMKEIVAELQARREAKRGA